MGLRPPRRPGHAGSLRHRRVQEGEPSDSSRNLRPRTAPRQKRQGVQARSGSRQTARRPQGAVLPRRANRRGYRRRARRRADFPLYLSLSRLQDALRPAVDQQPHRAGHPRRVGSHTARQRVRRPLPLGPCPLRGGLDRGHQRIPSSRHRRRTRCMVAGPGADPYAGAGVWALSGKHLVHAADLFPAQTPHGQRRYGVRRSLDAEIRHESGGGRSLYRSPGQRRRKGYKGRTPQCDRTTAAAVRPDLAPERGQHAARILGRKDARHRAGALRKEARHLSPHGEPPRCWPRSPAIRVSANRPPTCRAGS